MIDLLGLRLDDALLKLKEMGEGEYEVKMLSPMRGARDCGTARVVAARGRVLFVSRFIDMEARADRGERQ